MGGLGEGFREDDYVAMSLPNGQRLFYGPNRDQSVYNDISCHTPEQEADTVRQLEAAINERFKGKKEILDCFRLRFEKENNEDGTPRRKGQLVAAKSAIECILKRDVRGKRINDKYRTSFVY